LDISECVMPRVRVRVRQSHISLNEHIDLPIPQLEIDEIEELIDFINARLPDDFKPLEYLPEDPLVKVTLAPNQSIRSSANIADLLFESKTYIRNKVSEFKTRKDFHSNTYFLTCDALESLPVGEAQLPLLNSLTVNYLGGENHASLSWESTHEKAFLRPGAFNQLVFSINDRQGEPVKLNEGLLFLHLRLCT